MFNQPIEPPKFIPRKKVEFPYKILEKGDEIAMYYGFVPIRTPSIVKRDTMVAKIIKEVEPPEEYLEDELSPSHCLEEKISLLRTYLEINPPTVLDPLMMYYKGRIATSAKKKEGVKHYGLEIFGMKEAIAEVVLIKTAMTLLQEEGFKDLSVQINSAGDKDGAAKFLRELQTYYQKHSPELPVECRTVLKKDATDAHTCATASCQEISSGAPQSLSFLSEESRTHFKEILEYFETLGIPYEINNNLLSRKCFCQTIFEIRSGSVATPLALGMRYDSITKKMGLKKEIPAIGITLEYTPLVQTKSKKAPSHVMKRPKFYFLVLGFEAKLKSLQVIEMLRQAKIPICQSLSKEKLITQISVAESMKIPYVIIMGAREALDDAVIVRNMETRKQETVKISELPKFLEKMK